MASRRKVENLLALAVLAEITQRPMHRYEIASVLRAHGKERDMDVKLSSLYTVVQNLARHGFVEVVGTSRQGQRPERTTYRITEAGRQEMTEWTRGLISDPQSERSHFTAGLSIMVVLPPEEVIALLHVRVGRLEEAVAARRAELAELRPNVPRLFLVENEYALAILEAEAAWVRSLWNELATGTHPDVSAWGEWHRTGTMPRDLAAPAETDGVDPKPNRNAAKE
ncbi:MAG: PadR family transcriptional regulator [Chloroflexota bacterium]